MRIITAQDLMTLRDAAEELGDTNLAQELNDVGDKIDCNLKEAIDIENIKETMVAWRGKEIL